MNNSILYGTLMLFAGIGIPFMAALNGSLGSKLNSPVIAASLLFTVGLTIAILVMLCTEGLPTWPRLSSAPWYLYCGGAFVIFYILSITWVAPRFGVSNAVSFVLLGQLIAMTIIDHFGFVGMQQQTLTSERLIGLVVMAAGVLMVVRAPAE